MMDTAAHLRLSYAPDIVCMNYTSPVDTEVEERWEDVEDELDGGEDKEIGDDESWLEEDEFKADV